MQRWMMALATAAACFGPGCMLSPLHGESLDSHLDAVEFSGYTAAPGRLMTIECMELVYQSPTSADLEIWVPFVEVVSTEQQLGDDDEAYYFEVHAVIPEPCWDEQDNYTPRRQTRVRIVDTATGIVVDAWSASGYQCLATEYLTGSSPIEARDACASAGAFEWAGILAPLD